MRESEIKAALLSVLRAQGTVSPSSVLTTEYPLGKTSVRADLALLAGDFIGVEIKSQFDTLRRLPRQLDAYRQYFDRTMLVAAERHLPALDGLDLNGIELWVQRGHSLELLVVHAKSSGNRPLADLLTSAQRARWADRLEDEGRDAFVTEFTGRFLPTSRDFWKSIGRRQIKPEDITLLSRFRTRREGQVRLREERESAWTQWREPAECAA